MLDISSKESASIYRAECQLERLNLPHATQQATIMGFADLSIAEIAADYALSVEEVFHLCDRLGIVYKTQDTRLALEDAKAIISTILSQKPG